MIKALIFLFVIAIVIVILSLTFNHEHFDAFLINENLIKENNFDCVEHEVDYFDIDWDSIQCDNDGKNCYARSIQENYICKCLQNQGSDE